MTKTALLLLICTAVLAVSGCGHSDFRQKSVPQRNAATDDTAKLCGSIETAGFSKQCVVNSRDSTVHIIIDSNDDEVGREICADVVSKMVKLTTHFSGQWMLKVFSPYRSDKPMASCPLH